MLTATEGWELVSSSQRSFLGCNWGTAEYQFLGFKSIELETQTGNSRWPEVVRYDCGYLSESSWENWKLTRTPYALGNLLPPIPLSFIQGPTQLTFVVLRKKTERWKQERWARTRKKDKREGREKRMKTKDSERCWEAREKGEKMEEDKEGKKKKKKK